MDGFAVTVITWLAMTIRLATPLLFAALGGILAEKSGVFNFALEGMMLAGAFFGYYGSLISGNPWVGVLFALIVGALTGLLLGYTSVKLGVSQMVVGLGINIFYLGLTGYFYRLIDDSGANTIAANFPEIGIPVLSNIPVVGEIFFRHNIMVYLGLIVVIFIAWFLSKTTIGLSLRSVGENPKAADTVGINVYQYRYVALLFSGMLAATGGAFLTLTQVTRFLENMVEGRGWIALAAIILGKWSPWGALGACLLFGAANALQMQMQIIGVKVPYQVLLMLPYIMAMLTLAGVVGKVRGPASVGKPYLRS